jgi:DNA polymerase-3 subunit gamma/tau
MALIRLAYAADLPPTDRLVKDVLENGAAPARGHGSAAASRPPPEGGPKSGSRGTRENNFAEGSSMSAARDPSPKLAAQVSTLPQGEGGIVLRNLEDLAALADAHGAKVLKVHIEGDMHLVALEPGRIEFRPSARAPRSLAGDLAQKLKDWTGQRWVVTVAGDGGAPTLREQKDAADSARLESVMAEPMVRAVLDRFPGAEVVRVIERDAAADLPAESEPESDESAEDA